MNAVSTWTLRFDAVFLFGFGLFGLVSDFRGYIAGAGSLGHLLFDNPLTIGVAEAHGLALIIAVVLARNATVTDRRFGHGVGMATHLLLGVCNLVFWRIFIDTGLFALGVVSTSLHGLFVLANAIGIARKPA